jgi:hypothetical protein
VISFHRKGPTLPGRSSRLADHPHIKGSRASQPAGVPDWSGGVRPGTFVTTGSQASPPGQRQQVSVFNEESVHPQDHTDLTGTLLERIVPVPAI